MTQELPLLLSNTVHKRQEATQTWPRGVETERHGLTQPHMLSSQEPPGGA